MNCQCGCGQEVPWPDIWVVEKIRHEQTLWETRAIHGYTLVDDEYRPLRDEQGNEYFFQTIAAAERKANALLLPLVNRVLRDVA